MAMTEKATALVQSIRSSALDNSQQSLDFTNDEHSQTFWVALRRHWPAVTWGLFMNLVRENWDIRDRMITLTRQATVLKGIVSISSIVLRIPSDLPRTEVSCAV
jgi:hypothetical protein